MNISFPRTLSAALPALLLLSACAHSGAVGSIGGGGNPPPPDVFTIEDLEGDWVGQLTPDNSARPVQNVYLRFVNEQLTSAADRAGNEWRADNSDRVIEFSAKGVLDANLGTLVGVSGLEIRAEMNHARVVLTGNYIQVGSDLFPVAGTLELVRSSGASMFDEAMLLGDWTGEAVNALERSQILNFTLDANGAVLAGAMIRNGMHTVRRTYSAGAGTFSFFDSAIGRMENVVITADNGVISTFHYLLLDRNGSLLAGPGTDQKLGAGMVRLHR